MQPQGGNTADVPGITPVKMLPLVSFVQWTWAPRIEGFAEGPSGIHTPPCWALYFYWHGIMIIALGLTSFEGSHNNNILSMDIRSSS